MPNLEEQLTVVNAVIQFARLVALDGVWTEHLRLRDPSPWLGQGSSEQDVWTLDRLVSEMAELLEQAPDRAGELADVVHMYAAQLEDEYVRTIVEGHDLDGAQRKRVWERSSAEAAS